MEIDENIIAETLKKARISDRKHTNTCLHNPEDITQKMVSAGLSSAYFRPHRHEDLPRQETFQVLRGKIAVFVFNDEGTVTDLRILGKGESFQIPLNVYHTIAFLSGEAVVYETSEGKFNAATHKRFADWAPEENTKEAKEYLEELKKRASGAKKTVLITGISGFIAHHVAEAILRETDWNIISIDRIDEAGNLGRLENIEMWPHVRDRVKFIWHDLKAPINELVSKKIGANVDYILHLAAGSHVDRSIENPLDFVHDNIIGTAHLLEYARKLPNLKLFNYFSTDEVFGPAPEGINYKEGDPHNPKNPYAATKAAAEDLCIAYENTYKLPVFITNTMNVFGERQHPEKFIPKVIKSVLNGETITIHSHPSRLKAGTRFYIHARNVASALMFLLEHAKPGERYNIVGEKEVDNLTLAQFIAKVIGKPLKYDMIDFHSSRPGHDLRYALDGTKLQNMGFKYPKNLESSLEKTIKWYLENKEWLN